MFKVDILIHNLPIQQGFIKIKLVSSDLLNPDFYRSR